MKLSEVFKMKGTYPKWHEKIFHSLQNLKVTGKCWNWLGKHDVVSKAISKATGEFGIKEEI